MNDANEVGRQLAQRVKSVISKALIGFSERIDALANRLKALEEREPVRDGKDASPEMVSEAVAAYLAANPPAAGKDGKDAQPIQEEDVEKAVAGYLALHPIRDGRDGLAGRDGKDGEKGLDGKDGEAGRDGVGFDDLDIGFDLDSRTFTFKFQRGEYIKTIPVKAAGIPVQRGVFKRDKGYEHGDIVTWDGSQWFATKDTQLQPKVGNDWQLIVKRGNDGKEGKEGKKGETGLNGKDGRDLTHIAPDGSRY